MAERQGPKIYADQGGEGETTYVLLHGLGATGAVWQGVRDIISEKKAGRWVIPDLRGHGRSDWAPTYGLGEHAGDVVDLLKDSDRIVIVGHSMGGLIGLFLATGWFSLNTAGIVVNGTISHWNDGITNSMNALAEKPSRWFEDRSEAVERYLKVSGLIDVLPPDAPQIQSGIVEEAGKYRLAADNKAGTVGGPWMQEFYNISTCPVTLAVGEHDKIVTIEQYRSLDKNAVQIPNVAHNAHVENPEAMWALVEKLEGMTSKD